MLTKISAKLFVSAIAAALLQMPALSQGIFQMPGGVTPSGNPFTSPFSGGYGAGGFGYAPALVTPFAISPFSYGSGLSSFGGGWLNRPIGYGGFGNYGGFNSFSYPGGLGYGGYGGYGGFGNFGNFGYPGAFGGYGGYGGYGNFGYPGGFLGGYGGFGYSGYGWGGNNGNPFTGGGANYSPYSSSGELGTLGPHQQVIQAVPSKASGNYYQPSTVDPTASGSYYADSAPQTQQQAPAPRHNGWNSQANWTSPSGDGNFWGSGGNGLPKDLNSVPWNK